MLAKPEACCFLIADVSGYTEYLAAVEIEHAHDILADLIGTVVSSLKPTFRLAKLEGDAAFVYVPAAQVDGSLLLDTIERCYFGFRRRRRDIRQATSCECNACTRIPDLNLKFVAHHGLAVRQRLAGGEELLGSDVIVVHRLLKNSVVDATGIPAYALLSQRLVDVAGIDPQQMGMREHRETYEHVGETRLWIHDLEARWHEEDSRQRVRVEPDAAQLTVSVEVAAPPQIVWEFLTRPGDRLRWQNTVGVVDVVQQVGPKGRRGVGTINHCMHGPEAQVEEILDWRPFDYFTDRMRPPGGPHILATTELEPTSDGTRVHLRYRAERRKDVPTVAQFAQHFEPHLRTALDALAGEAAAESRTREAT